MKTKKEIITEFEKHFVIIDESELQAESEVYACDLKSGCDYLVENRAEIPKLIECGHYIFGVDKKYLHPVYYCTQRKDLIGKGVYIPIGINLNVLFKETDKILYRWLEDSIGDEMFQIKHNGIWHDAHTMDFDFHNNANDNDAKIKELDEIYIKEPEKKHYWGAYGVFIIAYELMKKNIHADLDMVWNEAINLYIEFEGSGYNEGDYSEMDCIYRFLETKKKPNPKHTLDTLINHLETFMPDERGAAWVKEINNLKNK